MTHYIGVLGGLGYRATLLAYEKLNKLYQAKIGDEHTCPVRLTAIDFSEINALLPYQIDEVAQKMRPHLLDMDAQEVVSNIMINNTLHEAVDVLSHQIKLHKPFGHVGKLLHQTLLEKQPNKVMLIGTQYTMNAGYMQRYIPSGIALAKCGPDLQNQLEKLRKIYYTADDSFLAKNCFDRIIAEHPDVDMFIIGCTEHSLAFSQYTNKENWVDTLDLQCAYSINELLKFTNN